MSRNLEQATDLAERYRRLCERAEQIRVEVYPEIDWTAIIEAENDRNARADKRPDKAAQQNERQSETGQYRGECWQENQAHAWGAFAAELVK